MQKVKEYLGDGKNRKDSYMPFEVLNAIKETDTKIIVIQMSNGTRFVVSDFDEKVIPNTFITLKHVFIDGTEYRKKVIINTNFISNVIIE